MVHKFQKEGTLLSKESLTLAYKTTSHYPVVSTIVLYVTTAARPHGQKRTTKPKTDLHSDIPFKQAYGDKVLILILLQLAMCIL